MTKTYKEVWNRNSPELFSALDETPLWSAPFGQRLLEAIVLKPGLRVLDVGCGLGYPALELAQRLGTRAHVVGLDPCRPALDRMVFKARQQGVRNISCVLGIAEQMPFESDRFDLLVSNNGLNNVTDDDAAFAECSRVAKPGAQMVLTVNLPGSMAEFYAVYAEVLEALGLGDRVAAMHRQIREKRKPLDETCKRISDAGFALTSVREDAFVWRYVDGSAMLAHFVIRLAFLPGFQSILSEKERETIFDAVEIRLNKKAFEDGELRLTIPFACLDCQKK